MTEIRPEDGKKAGEPCILVARTEVRNGSGSRIVDMGELRVFESSGGSLDDEWRDNI